VWRARDGACVHLLTAHSMEVGALAVLGPGRFVSGSKGAPHALPCREHPSLGARWPCSD